MKVGGGGGHMPPLPPPPPFSYALAHRVKEVFGRPDACVRIGLERKRPLAAHGMDARQQV